VIITSVELTSVPLVRLPNNVTIMYTNSRLPDNTATPLFIPVNLRGTGNEWFAVVDNRHLQAIQNYVRGLPAASALFTPPGQSSPVSFNNIVTTLMTDMSGMFAGATSFNSEISSWDTSRVRFMVSMFGGATAFDQPLNSWNVSNVLFMDGMFLNASSFNQPLNSWNVSWVMSMISMFAFATSFNQNISGWVVNNVRFANQFRLGNILLTPNQLPRFRSGVTM
jgi:surface protein